MFARINFKSILRTVAHAAVSAVAVSLAAAMQSGQPITSANVLFPAAIAGALAAGHAASKSTLGVDILPEADKSK